ncbi:MAG: ribosome small subunit-dependent GTPase A [Defluviitaleaceae bacterium]|nr:ribosome small subunit-dependent GTPase A [Defluviitaleaceae bacterium]
MTARVIEQHRDHYKVSTPHGEVQAELKGSLIYDAVLREELPCVGDFVRLRYNENGPSIIEEVLPRSSKFSRANHFGGGIGHVKANREQVVAANFDYVFIITSLNKDFSVNRVSRYLTQAWQSGGQPVILLSKADLVENFAAQLAEVSAAAPGVPVHAISTYTGLGLDELEEYLQPEKVIVFLGMSGVGKSSLVNALMSPGKNETVEVMAVKEIREDDSRGRHTTTHRQLLTLPSGAMVIDTPGMREIGIYDAEEGISASFADVESLFADCRFSDCRHETEPDCAVRAALADGTLSPEQWERYQAQARENKYLDNKIAFRAMRAAQYKSLAKWSKEMKKSGGIRK